MTFKTYAVLAFAGMSLLLTSCTSIKVKPVAAGQSPQHICIEINPKVAVTDFVDVLEQGLQRHNISSEVYSGRTPPSCHDVLTYTALRSWDFAPYLTYAMLRLRRDGQLVASAEYRLRGRGGFSLMKWQGTETKMTPVIDRLFAAQKEGATIAATMPAPTDADPMPSPPLYARRAIEEIPDAEGDTTRPVAATTGDAVAVARTAKVDTPDGASIEYSDDPRPAILTLGRIYNCNGSVESISQGSDGQVFGIGCWGTRKLLVRCIDGHCSTMR